MPVSFVNPCVPYVFAHIGEALRRYARLPSPAKNGWFTRTTEPEPGQPANGKHDLRMMALAGRALAELRLPSPRLVELRTSQRRSLRWARVKYQPAFAM